MSSYSYLGGFSLSVERERGESPACHFNLWEEEVMGDRQESACVSIGYVPMCSQWQHRTDNMEFKAAYFFKTTGPIIANQAQHDV